MGIVGTTNPDGFDLGPNPRALQLVWFSLLILGQAGLAFLLMTFYLSRSLCPRMPVLYNLVLLSFLATPIYLILFYSNEYMNTNPPYSLCLVQAIFKHGIDPAFLLASFLHVFETWQNASRGPVQQTHSKARQRIILGLPHLNFVVASISTAVMGTRFPEKVARGGHSFFCTINDGPFGTIWAVEMAILAFGTLACQGGICILFWKHRTAARLLGAPSSLDHFQLMRISIFNVCTLVCSTFLAILPLFVFIIFSSHKDILKYWCHSRRAETSKTIPPKPEDDLYLP
ncbi:hypothetical protein SISNIDRAFT_253886 [Sistotremastrum niveocremeum HHB9708]|uniref:G-protein coupled receptors family 1 profile domain-containing protein n=1 Tax=Sistotremastrum niveocremeum HHB9708 TaxID=1314777 RepID=A0A164PJ53_9AGAM|nr:hypothetical protein SISNIDRAFT_253886 [Sistotremastrum niveocremeum HHB9708]